MNVSPSIIHKATHQLERSERGQMTCKMLLDFLNSVKDLDGSNCDAVGTLVVAFLCGTGQSACDVVEALRKVVERNRWVNLPTERR